MNYSLSLLAAHFRAANAATVSSRRRQPLVAIGHMQSHEVAAVRYRVDQLYFWGMG